MKDRIMLFRAVFAVCAALLWISSTYAAADPLPSYPRPAFDKSAYCKTVWSTANPWWPPNLSHRLFWWGGPDYSWDDFSGDRVTMWKEVAERYAGYGLTGLQMETAVYVNGARETAEGFAASGTGMKVIPFMQVHGGNADEAAEFLLKVFGRFQGDLQKHPGFYRLDGRPVVFIYLATRFNSEEWKKIISAVEREHGNMIWLFDAAMVGIPEKEWPGKVRDLMKSFDGVSMYANWSTLTQEKLYRSIAALIKQEFPDKIFEGGVHTNYTNHLWFGGAEPDLTGKYRRSWEITTAAEPDSITVTNWFDILENSRIMPSYEEEDIRLRLLQYSAAKWRGETLPETDMPLIYAAWPTHVLLGQNIDCELLVFPCRDKGKPVQVQLELWTGDDRKIRTFLTKNLVNPLDELQVFRFTIPSEVFKDELAVYPRLRYCWGDKWYLSEPLPHINISTSIRSRLMYWARSNQKLLSLDIEKPWRLGSASAGGILPFGKNPVVWRGSGKFVKSSGLINGGGEQVRFMRNWREFGATENLGLDFNKPMALIPPQGALDWYNLELTNDKGARYLSKPIWVHDGSRDRDVTLPIYSLEKKDVVDVIVKDYRIPFFLYECGEDTGSYLLDSSGNDHHGSLNQGFRRGGLYRTSYRHEHTGKMPADQEPQARFAADYHGRPGLVFDGKGTAVIMGGTAFPYSFTYEMEICPENISKRQTFLSSGNGQIGLTLLDDGRVEATRASATEGAGGEKLKTRKSGFIGKVTSKSSLKPGEWSHVAVVYDLRKLKLYIDGKLEGETAIVPSRDGEWINPLIIGGSCRFPYWGVPQFIGGVRNIRLYGRPLAPEEFFRN